METIIIQNFKFGLDSRRSELTSQPGTLEVCENAHINAGGEIEKRKAFVDGGAFPIIGGEQKTFGLEVTDEGLVTFGSFLSVPPPSTPPGVTYQRLTHVSAAVTKMTSVLFSTNLNGKAFVLAVFDNTHVAAFYNSVYVGAFVNGKLIGADDGTILAQDMLRQLQVELDDWTSSRSANIVSAKSPAGVQFAPTVTEDSTGGEIIATEVSQNVAGTAPTPAKVSFTLNSGSTGTIQVMLGSTNLGGPVTYDTSLANTATLLVAAINTLTISHGYKAAVNGAKVTIFARLSQGNFTSQISVVMTGDLTVIAASPDSDTGVYIDPPVVDATVTARQGRSQKVVSPKVTVYGGTSPYTWAEASTGSGGGITIAANGNQATFYKVLALNESARGQFKVTDSAGSPATKYFDVSLSLESIN